MFVTCILNGGLGNQMFQLAFLYTINNYLNRFTDCQIILDRQEITKILSEKWKRGTYWESVFCKFNKCFYKNVLNKFNKDLIYICEYTMNIQQFLKNYKYDKDLCFTGYFQSYKYFIDNYNQIINLFAPNKEDHSKIFKKFEDLSNEFKTDKFISVHVRRGDYFKHSDQHPVLTKNYYYNAINRFTKEYVLLFFSDDIEWCVSEFGDIDREKYFINNMFDYEELFLMSLCKHNIIANSTFSWWGAFLNKNPQKKVIIPDPWFGKNPSSHCNASGLYLPKWEIIKDMSLLVDDTTFINKSNILLKEENTIDNILKLSEFKNNSKLTKNIIEIVNKKIAPIEKKNDEIIENKNISNMDDLNIKKLDKENLKIDYADKEENTNYKNNINLILNKIRK